MNIYYCDSVTKRIGMVQEFSSMIWTTKLLTSTLDMKLPLSELENVMAASFIEREGVNTLMQIKTFEIDYSDGSVTLSAVDYIEQFSRRVSCWTKTFDNKRIEEYVVTLANYAVATPSPAITGVASSRAIPLMNSMVNTYATSTYLNSVIGKEVSWGSAYENICEALALFPVRFYGLWTGYEMPHVTPTLYEGSDKSANVVFGAEYGDLFNVKYASVDTFLNGTAIVGGQGEGIARKVVVASNSLNGAVESYGEVWVDANDIDDAEGTLLPAQVTSALRQRGIETLQEQPHSLVVSGDIEQRRFKFREDFFVGDRVGYKMPLLVGSDTVTEVAETFEGGQSTIAISIGTNYPTIKQLLYRRTKR